LVEECGDLCYAVSVPGSETLAGEAVWKTSFKNVEQKLKYLSFSNPFF
jgi:hypothetical protein